MPKISTSDGFITSMAPRRNKISMLAFEVANTITRGSTLFHSLSEENIQLLKNEVLQSEGLQKLVSTDTKELLTLIGDDKRFSLVHIVSYKLFSSSFKILLWMYIMCSLMFIIFQFLGYFAGKNSMSFREK
jgi:hypothetical protein